MEDTYLFIDTETTGFKKSGPLIQEGQARVCQVAMILTDSQGKSLTEFCTLIKPDGWQIHEGAFNIHGISNDDCEKYGIEQPYFTGMFLKLETMAGIVVAHNSVFDKAMINIEIAYHVGSGNRYKYITNTPWHCTQKTSTDICCVPPTEKMIAAGRTHYKTPSLAEAYLHFTGRKIEGAHDAMADTRACRDIFFAMRGIQIAA